MKNKKLAAFTLVEALIGVIIMMIVIGGIALSIKMGIDMYGRAEAHSELINGMRFTLDSFNREISPMLDVTREVEMSPPTSQTFPAFRTTITTSTLKTAPSRTAAKVATKF